MAFDINPQPKGVEYYYRNPAEAVSTRSKHGGKPVGHNRYVIFDSESKELRMFLHGTAVVTVKYFHDEDMDAYVPARIVLDTGGWDTVTTRDAINQYLGAMDLKVSVSVGMFQRKLRVYIGPYDSPHPRKAEDFTDGKYELFTL